MNKNKLIEVKKRFLILSMAALMSTNFAYCHNSSDNKINSKSSYNIESFEDEDYSNNNSEKQNEFMYFSYPNEQWHTFKANNYKKSDYDFVIETNIISSVEKITNDDGSITYMVPKGYSLKESEPKLENEYVYYQLVESNNKKLIKK